MVYFSCSRRVRVSFLLLYIEILVHLVDISPDSRIKKDKSNSVVCVRFSSDFVKLEIFRNIAVAR